MVSTVIKKWQPPIITEKPSDASGSVSNHHAVPSELMTHFWELSCYQGDQSSKPAHHVSREHKMIEVLC